MVGHWCDALTESIIGLYKTECIGTTVFHDAPYKTVADVEYATVDWYNHRRLHSRLDYTPGGVRARKTCSWGVNGPECVA